MQIPEINRAPCSTTLIAGFITYLSGRYSRTAITNFIAAIKAWHLVNLLPCDLDDLIISKLLRGASKVQPLPLPRREPLTIEQLNAIIINLNTNQYEEAAVAACLSTCFYSCARLGEFTVQHQKAFKPSEHITIKNVSFQKDRFFNKVTVFNLPRTKTCTTRELVFWASQKGPSDP